MRNKISQRQRLFKAFSSRPASMLMVSRLTGVERAAICRFVAAMQQARKIALIKFDLCKVSKHKAGYYSTDTKYF